MTQNSTDVGAGAATGPNVHASKSLTAKAADEFRKFLVLFFYLWILFGVFVLNQGVVLREHGFDFAPQGFAFINALVFAKVMMLFEIFDPGRWLRKRPLIYPILYENSGSDGPLPCRPCARKDARRTASRKDNGREHALDRRRRPLRIAQRNRHPVYRADPVFRPEEFEPGHGRRAALGGDFRAAFSGRG